MLGDEQRLAALNGFVQSMHFAKRPDHFKPSTNDEVVEWFRGLLQDTSARMWIAEDAGAVVGYILTIVQVTPRIHSVVHADGARSTRL